MVVIIKFGTAAEHACSLLRRAAALKCVSQVNMDVCHMQVLDQGELTDFCGEGLEALAFRTYVNIDAEPSQLRRRPRQHRCSLQYWQLPVVLDPEASSSSGYV